MEGLYIRNVTDPAFSYHFGTCATPGGAHGVAISGEYAFVADGGNGLQVIDISDKEGPVIIGTCDTPGNANGVALTGDYAFVADKEKGLQIIEITGKNTPEIVGACDTPGNAMGVTLTGDYTFVTDGEKGLQVIDISDKEGPVIVGTCDTPGNAQGVAISGECVFVADGSGLQVIDISDKEGQEIIGSCNTHGTAQGVTLSGDYAFVADGEKDLQVIDISDKEGPVRVGTCDTPGNAIGVTLSGDYAFVADGESGLQVIDISDKKGPVRVGACDTPAPGNAIGVAQSGDYAFVADGESGLQVIDISDKEWPVIVGTCDTPGIAMGVALSGDYAFVADGSGLQVIDISDKKNPEIVGTCDILGWVMGVVISGDYAFVANGSGLRVIDISDKKNPEIVGTRNTVGHTYRVILSGEYAFVADGRSGLQVIDISDKENPEIVGTCDTLGFAKGVALSGEYAFVADGSSLQVIDIGDKEGPEIVGACDIPDSACEVALSGEYAFVANGGSGLQVINISDKNGPVRVGTCDTPGEAWGVAIYRDYAFVADGGSGLQVININDKNGLEIIGTCHTPGIAMGVALSGEYAFVADGIGLQVINISDKNGPVRVGTCDTPGEAWGVAIYRDYAFVADGVIGLQVIDISDKEGPEIVGTCDTYNACGVALSGKYAFVADDYIGLQVIDISDKENPEIVSTRKTLGFAEGVALSGEYAFVADKGSGLQVIDISDKKNPRIVSFCDTDGNASRVTISGDYAFVADGKSGLQMIDITDKEDPRIVGFCDTDGYAYEVALFGNYAFVADGENGLLKFKINIGSPPKGKGNLILIAGGNINYKSLIYSALSQQPTKILMRKRETTLDSLDNKTAYWKITQTHANLVFNTFQKSGYEVYDIYYFNLESLQDTDNNGAFNQMAVDDPFPTRKGLMDIIKEFPENQFGNHLANRGPLYIYLIGHAAEDRFLITPNEVITAKELKDAIDRFRNGYTDNEGTHHPGTNRQVVVIIESAASGTFINNLVGPGISVITSTDDGASYIKPDFSDPNHIPYNSFTKAFMDALGLDLDPNNITEGPHETLSARINNILKEAFIDAREQLRQWALAGQPFADQAPQMSLPENTYTFLSFWDGNKPVDHLFIDQNIPQNLTIIAEDLFGSIYYLSPSDILLYSSDPDILDPEGPEDMKTYTDPNGILWYRITPKKNGRIILTGHADPEMAPDHLLSAKLTLDISIDHPGFAADPERIAIIVSGYRGTGDYLWESTNTIANHAYKTLTDMGYAKDEIYYYNPYILQDIDENGRYDDIKGYPHKSALDPDTAHSPLALIKERGVKEILIFLVDHGSIGSFSINPKEKLSTYELIDYIKAIYSNVEKVILVYDACNSGSFLKEIEEDGTLSQKLIAITSTETDQAAYFLNRGIVSFSYPFLEEWFLTHSLLDAFDHATCALPRKGQNPCITDPDIVWEWDRENIYYTDESRPAIEEVEYTRENGRLNITAMVYSLPGIKEVWVIIEGIKEPISNPLGEAITETNKLILEPSSDPNSFGVGYRLDIPDPCPNETNYLINLYALDKSRRPKMASYKTAIGTPIKNQTLAFIIGDPNIIKDLNNRQKVENQINRAEEILKRKGLDEGSIKRITKSTELENLAFLFEENKGRNLFIYLIGEGDTRDGKPYFSLNPNDISPSTLSHLPYDPNQHLLILMDSPYAKQFLSAMDTNTLPKNWAGIASTDQERLFFNFQEKSYPFFSNFFFSLVLSGATVSQAYRMAHNAVSLTRQNPEAFLPEKALSYNTINRHLNYYLGTSGIYGEDSLISDCTAKIEDKKIKLSLTAHPEIDTIKSTVWAILKSSPSSIDQETRVVDFYPDPNNGTHTIKTGLRYIPDKDIPYDSYCRALFIVEGRRVSDETTKTEWEEIPIAAPESEIKEDKFEPDDDPKDILFDPNHEVIINAMPRGHTFYCGYPEVCPDIDWVYFYAAAGQIYEIYAQDLSEYSYFIRSAIYDASMMLHCDPNSGQCSVANNYLTFACKESGYYFLKVELASSYPQGGVDYILSICDPQGADGYTDFVFQVKDTLKHDLSLIGKINDPYISPDIYNFIFSESCHSWKFNGLKPYTNITLYIYEGSDFVPIEELTVKLLCRGLNEVIITFNELNKLNNTNKFTNPKTNKETVYYNIVKGYDIDPNKLFPFGDKDPNLPPAGDYDGDGILNCDEVMVYSSYPYYPNIPLPLFKGLNLFYFPSVSTKPNIVSEKVMNIINQICYYEPSTKTWQDAPLDYFMIDNAFNVIDVSSPGLLYLDLNEEPTIPVLWLKGFLDSGDSCEGSQTSCCLNTNLFDPNSFNANASISEILNNPNLPEIEEIISGHGFLDGKWESSYPFFGRLMGQDKRIDPYGVYFIKNSLYH